MSNDGKSKDGRPVSPINGQPLPVGKKFTSENAREMQKRSTAKKQREKSIQQAFLNILAESYQVKDKTSGKPQEQSGAEILAAAIFKDACSQHNHKFVELALSLAGEVLQPQRQDDNGKLEELIRDLQRPNNGGGES